MLFSNIKKWQTNFIPVPPVMEQPIGDLSASNPFEVPQKVSGLLRSGWGNIPLWLSLNFSATNPIKSERASSMNPLIKLS